MNDKWYTLVLIRGQMDLVQMSIFNLPIHIPFGSVDS